MKAELTFEYAEEFVLESGQVLNGFHLSYTTLGEVNSDRSNVIWVCHALTGNADVQQWWPGLFDEGALFDPKEYFIICANCLGGCYGSTGPLSTQSGGDRPYFHDFPKITNRDIARAFDILRQDLGLSKIHTLMGGSLGGQHAIEWAILEPEVAENLIGVATNALHSPWGIAFNETQRMAIANDSTWSTASPKAGLKGMETARAMALLSYRNYLTYKDTQDDSHEGKTESFRASSYQRYQGEKLAKRFNAFSYWWLSEAMDSHNVGRGRGGLQQALAGVRAKSLFIGIRSDVLFPIEEQIFLAANIKDSSLEIIESRYGHDGFLIETAQISRTIKKFYRQAESALV